MMKQLARLYKLLVFSRLAMLETNGMKLSSAGCDGGGGQGGRWKQEQGGNAMTMNHDGTCLNNGFGRGGQGRGYRGGGYGQGGRWNQVDDDTSVMTNPRGQHHQGGRNSGDRATIQNLIDNRQHIHRTVEKTPDGIQTHTWSHEKQVSDWITQHVHSMKDRMEEGNRIRQRDPLFVAAFDHAHLIDDFVVEEEDNGVKVTETSRDPCTVDIFFTAIRTLYRALLSMEGTKCDVTTQCRALVLPLLQAPALRRREKDQSVTLECKKRCANPKVK